MNTKKPTAKMFKAVDSCCRKLYLKHGVDAKKHPKEQHDKMYSCVKEIACKACPNYKGDTEAIQYGCKQFECKNE